MDEDLAAGHEGLADDAQSLDLVVEVVHRVVKDRCVESVSPGQAEDRHRMELGERLDSLPDRRLDGGDPFPRDLHHVLGDVDAGDRVAAAREELAQPAGAAADIQDLRAHTQVEPRHDVRKDAEALDELPPRRDAERLRPQPEFRGLADALDVPSMRLGVVLAEARQAASPQPVFTEPFHGVPTLAAP